MAPKKTTVKTTAKKAVTKKTVPKKTAKRSNNKAVIHQHIGKAGSLFETSAILAWGLVVLLLGGIIGMLSGNASIIKKFSGEQAMVVVGDTTWMPVEGKPVSVIILNDKTCGQSCDTTQTLASLKQNITPALMVRNVDISEEEGKKLLESFDLVSVPQVFFGKELKELKASNGTNFVDNLPAGMMILKNDLYYVDGARVGFKVGKYIKKPTFADLDSEPKKGEWSRTSGRIYRLPMSVL